jgi:RNA polymerase sigma factor (sigma-70 family)
VNPRLLPSARVARSVLRTQSDTRLTELARAGSEPAFEAIVARYRRSLVRYCARVVGEGDAEEAVQEALVKAHAALAGGDPVRQLGPWLRAVAHNTAVSCLRARSSRPPLADPDHDRAAKLDRAAEYRQELVEVLDAVRSLPDRQREAIVMRELEGRSYGEIAARLGSSQGAVRQLLHRARSSMRERLAALIPLEPLVRSALTGPGGAEAAGGATASGICVVGAKACAALILPAAAALIAAAPGTAPRTTTRSATRPVAATARHAHHQGASSASAPAPRPTGRAVETTLVARRVAAVHHPRRFSATSPRRHTPSPRRHTPSQARSYITRPAPERAGNALTPLSLQSGGALSSPAPRRGGAVTAPAPEGAGALPALGVPALTPSQQSKATPVGASPVGGANTPARGE